MNYCALPEDKWQLVGFLYNTTQSCVLVYQNNRTEPLIMECYSHRYSWL